MIHNYSKILGIAIKCYVGGKVNGGIIDLDLKTLIEFDCPESYTQCKRVTTSHETGIFSFLFFQYLSIKKNLDMYRLLTSGIL